MISFPPLFLPPSLPPSLTPTKERGLIPDLVMAGEVVKAIVQDQPLAVNQQDYNLDTKAVNYYHSLPRDLYTLHAILSHFCEV